MKKKKKSFLFIKNFSKTKIISRGVELALKLPNKNVKRECAMILEGIRVLKPNESDI